MMVDSVVGSDGSANNTALFDTVEDQAIGEWLARDLCDRLLQAQLELLGPNEHPERINPGLSEMPIRLKSNDSLSINSNWNFLARASSSVIPQVLEKRGEGCTREKSAPRSDDAADLPDRLSIRVRDRVDAVV